MWCVRASFSPVLSSDEPFGHLAASSSAWVRTVAGQRVESVGEVEDAHHRPLFTGQLIVLADDDSSGPGRFVGRHRRLDRHCGWERRRDAENRREPRLSDQGCRVPNGDPCGFRGWLSRLSSRRTDVATMLAGRESTSRRTLLREVTSPSKPPTTRTKRHTCFQVRTHAAVLSVFLCQRIA